MKGTGPENVRRAEIEKTWMKEHEISTHESCTPLRIDSANLFKRTVCNEKGVCVCAKPEALLFQKNLVLCLKHFFPAPKKAEKDSGKPTPNMIKRHQLQEGFFVLRLQSKPLNPDMAVSDLFLHLAYINFSSWDFACLKLDLWDELMPEDEIRLSALKDLEDDLQLL